METFESRIDKKGRLYIPSKIRKHDFFKQKRFLLFPIKRDSTKQTERGLLLINPADEFEAANFWGLCIDHQKYEIQYDAHGRLTTTESIMRDWELHSFYYKLIYFVKSAFGWELWPVYRFRRLNRTYHAFIFRIISNSLKGFSIGIWMNAALYKQFNFNKEAGQSFLYQEVGKLLKKKEKIFILLERMDDARLVFFNSPAQLRQEVDSFILSKGLGLAYPALDTETRLLPSGLVRISYFAKTGILKLLAERIRPLSPSEKSKQIADFYDYASPETARRLIELGIFRTTPFLIDSSDVYFTFSVYKGEHLDLNAINLSSSILLRKNVTLSFGNGPSVNIEKETI